MKLRLSLLALLVASWSLSAVAAESSTSSTPWALGAASTNVITETESFSALIGSNHNWIELDFGIHHVRHAFQFGVGGAYKFTVAGDRRTGFHVGPGLSLGTRDVGGREKFAFSVNGQAGGHFTVADHLLLTVDAGPALYVVDGDVDFFLRPRGAILGVGIYYLF